MYVKGIINGIIVLLPIIILFFITRNMIIDFEIIEVIVGIFVIIAWLMSGYFYKKYFGPIIFSTDMEAALKRLIYYVLGAGTIWGPFKAYIAGFPIQDVNPIFNLFLLIISVPLSGGAIIGALLIGGCFYKESDNASNQSLQSDAPKARR